nr:polysaccharide biosynthesis protein [Paludibacteraceae bacterium]
MTYLGVFVGFLTTFFVLTRFLTTEEIGLARVLIDTGTLFIGLAQLGTSSSIIRFFPYFNTRDKSQGVRDSHNGFFFWTVVIPLFGFTLIAFLYWLLHDSIAAIFSEKSALFITYYYAVLPLAFFMLYQTIFETNANVLMRIVFPRAVRELFLRLFLLAAYLLYAFRAVSMDGFIILLCSAYGLAALMNIIYL